MTNIKYIINQFSINKNTFRDLLNVDDHDLIVWKQSEGKWCLLEIICHLYDEERDDFRFRTKWVLERPNQVPPPFNPLNWIEERQYMKQNYQKMIEKFMSERDESIKWLKSLKNPKWDNSFEHPKLGRMTAKYFLNNWLAHDYLHMRQIIKLKFDYLHSQSKSDLNYAGTW